MLFLKTPSVPWLSASSGVFIMWTWGFLQRVVIFGCFSMFYTERIRLRKNGDRQAMSEPGIHLCKWGAQDFQCMNAFHRKSTFILGAQFSKIHVWKEVHRVFDFGTNHPIIIWLWTPGLAKALGWSFNFLQCSFPPHDLLWVLLGNRLGSVSISLGAPSGS